MNGAGPWRGLGARARADTIAASAVAAATFAIGVGCERPPRATTSTLRPTHSAESIASSTPSSSEPAVISPPPPSPPSPSASASYGIVSLLRASPPRTVRAADIDAGHYASELDASAQTYRTLEVVSSVGGHAKWSLDIAANGDVTLKVVARVHHSVDRSKYAPGGPSKSAFDDDTNVYFTGKHARDAHGIAIRLDRSGVDTKGTPPPTPLASPFLLKCRGYELDGAPKLPLLVVCEWAKAPAEYPGVALSIESYRTDPDRESPFDRGTYTVFGAAPGVAVRWQRGGHDDTPTVSVAPLK